MSPFENLAGKGENADHKHFFLFPQCFLFHLEGSSVIVATLKLSSASFWTNQQFYRLVNSFVGDQHFLLFQQSCFFIPFEDKFYHLSHCKIVVCFTLDMPTVLLKLAKSFAGNQHFLPTLFFIPFEEKFYHHSHLLNCRLQILLNDLICSCAITTAEAFNFKKSTVLSCGIETIFLVPFEVKVRLCHALPVNKG